MRLKLLNQASINVIRGKNLVGKASTSDVLALANHIQALEIILDNVAEEDFFGTEGWERFFSARAHDLDLEVEKGFSE